MKRKLLFLYILLVSSVLVANEVIKNTGISTSKTSKKVLGPNDNSTFWANSPVDFLKNPSVFLLEKRELTANSMEENVKVETLTKEEETAFPFRNNIALHKSYNFTKNASATATLAAAGVVEVDEIAPADVEDYVIASLLSAESQDCAQITNVTSFTGTDDGVNGIGSFNRQSGVDFPLSSGILLSSGEAAAAQGPLQSDVQSAGNNNWVGDPDLQNLIQPKTTHNASVIEFDIEVFGSQLSFDYVFASEEYGQFQCTQYFDTFAFLVKEEGSSDPYQNIATYNGDMVNVTTIRNGIYNTEQGCPSVNADKFGNYYGPNQAGADGIDAADAPVNFRGHTKQLTAQMDTEPGKKYHIKLVIADSDDTVFDSAIFIGSGSLKVANVNLGPDISGICEGEDVVLDSGLPDPLGNINYTWRKEDGSGQMVVIPGANDPTYTATESGHYEVTASAGFLDTDCKSTDDIWVEFTPTPTAGNPVDIEVCTVNPDHEFNLTANDINIRDGLSSSDYRIRYYDSKNKAQNFPDNNITDPTKFTIPSGGETTVFARLEYYDSSTGYSGCYDIAEFKVKREVLTMGNLADLTQCFDPDTDQAIFDLTENTPNALGLNYSASNYTVKYYDSGDSNDALNDNGALSSSQAANYEHDTKTPKTIYVRLERNGEAANCYVIGSFEINPSYVEAGQPSDLQACDDGSGSIVFDLTTYQDDIRDGKPASTHPIKYYTSRSAAVAGGNGNISGPANHTVSFGDLPKMIYARLENQEGCYDVVDFELNANGLSFNPDDFKIDVCGSGEKYDDVRIDLTQYQPDPNLYDVEFYPSYNAADLEQGRIGTPTDFGITEQSRTIYMRVEDRSLPGCHTIVPMRIRVFQSGIAYAPNDVYLCDNGTQTPFTYDLTQLNTEVLGGSGSGGQNPNELEITYYKNPSNRNSKTPDLDPVNYQPTNGDRIYVRINNKNSDCTEFDGTYFDIYVEELQIGAMPDMEVCKTGFDHTHPFDLTPNGAIAAAGQPGVTVSYYTNLDDANGTGSGTSEITDPANFISNLPSQTIYVRIDGQTGIDSCFLVDEFDVNIYLEGVAHKPNDLLVCDDTGGALTYNLTLVNSEVLTNVQNADEFDITFYTSQAGADAGPGHAHQITNPSSYSGSAGETIYVRIQNRHKDCGYDTTSFKLDVIPVRLELTPAADKEACYNQDTGASSFDLTQNIADIIPSGYDASKYNLYYYETEYDARNDINRISNITNYTGNNGENQRIWIRLEWSNFADFPCFNVDSFFLFPQLSGYPEIDEFYACDDGSGDLIVERSLIEAEVLGSQDPNEFEVTFHTSQADADAGTNAISLPYTATDGEVIWVRIQNKNYIDPVNPQNCHVVKPIEIKATHAEIADLEDLAVCVSGDSETAIFDLTQNDANALGGLPAGDYIIEYYDVDPDANPGATPISRPRSYQNTSNPQQIWVKIISRELDTCYDVDSFWIEVFPTGELNIPDPIYACNMTGSPEWDLSGLIADIMANVNPAKYEVFLYRTKNDAQNDTNRIDPNDPFNGTPTNTIWVVMRPIGIQVGQPNTCFLMEEFRIFETVNPSISSLDDLEECSDGAGTTAVFYLPDAFGGNYPSGYTVTYHHSQADADSGDNAIDFAPLPNGYYEGTDGEEIWVRVEHPDLDDPDCHDVKSFHLYVFPSGEANKPDDILACYNDPTAPVSVDLEAVAAQVLGSQDPADYTVYFYDDETYFDNHDTSRSLNTLTNWPIYTTTTSTRIWVRLENNHYAVCNESWTYFDIDVVALEFENLTNLSDCVEEEGETVFFDLWDALKDSSYTGSQDLTGIDVVFYPDDGSGNPDYANPIVNPGHYENQSNPETIHVRFRSQRLNSCELEGSFTIETFVGGKARPTHPIDICIDDINNVFTYDLTDLESLILSGQDPNLYEVTFYESDADGNLDIDSPITDPKNYNIGTFNHQIVIWAGVSNTSPGAADCATGYGRVNLQITAIDVKDFKDLEACDHDNDGIAEFNLRENDPWILGHNPDPHHDPDDYVVNYYESLADATSGFNRITDPENYQNNPALTDADGEQKIYFRLQALRASCFAIREFTIKAIPSGEAHDLDDIYLCDNGVDELSFDLNSKIDEFIDEPNRPGNYLDDFDISFHEDNSGVAGGSIPSGKFNASGEYLPEDGDVVWIRIANKYKPTSWTDFTQLPDDPRLDPGAEGLCYNEIPLTFHVSDVSIEDLKDLELCDDVSDFDLTLNDKLILGSRDAGDYVINYYDSSSNLIVNPSAYAASNAPETITAEIVRDDADFDPDYFGNTCSYSDTFEIRVLSSGVANPLSDEYLCHITGVDIEFTPADWTDKANEVLDGQSTSDFEVEFYQDLGGNPDLSNPIDQSVIYNPADDEVIHARIKPLNFPVVDYQLDNGVWVPIYNESCDDWTQFSFKFSEIAMGGLDDLESCDTAGDGFGTFDLTVNDANARAGQDPSFVVKYYYTDTSGNLVEIDNSDPSLDREAFVNDPGINSDFSNPMTITVEVSHNDPSLGIDCEVYDTFTIEAIPVRVGTPVDLEICAEDINDFGEFDLTRNDDRLLDGQSDSDYTVTYHYFDGSDWVVISNPGNFVNDPSIDANFSNPMTIRATVSKDGFLGLDGQGAVCSLYEEFDIESYSTGIATAIDDIPLCDVDPANPPQFDLTTLDPDVLDGLDPNEYTVSYFEDDGSNAPAAAAISNAATYEPTTQSTKVWARIENQHTVIVDYDSSGDPIEDTCYQFAEESFEFLITTVQIDDLEDLEECADDNNEYAIFDLTQNESIAVANPNDFDFTYYYVYLDGGGTEVRELINNPTSFVNNPAVNHDTSNPQTIEVEMKGNGNGIECTTVGRFDVTAYQSGVAHTPGDEEFGFDGTVIPFEYDLTLKDDYVRGLYATPTPPVQSSSDFTVTYYTDQTDAANGTNAIGAGNTDGNTDPQHFALPQKDTTITIYARIENNHNVQNIDGTETSCYDLTEFDIRIFDVVVGDLIDLADCNVRDNSGLDSGFAEFDLTENDKYALGYSNPNDDRYPDQVADYQITYHTSLADAQTGNSPISNPGNYSAPTGTTTIWVRVETTNLTPPIHDIGSFTLEAFAVGDAGQVGIYDATRDDYILDYCDNGSVNPFGVDLADHDLTVLNGLDPNVFDVVYYVEDDTDPSDLKAGADISRDATTGEVWYVPTDGERIYARIINNGRAACYDEINFVIDIMPVRIGILEDQQKCSDDISGMVDFDLIALNEDNALGIGQGQGWGQDIGAYRVTFHESQADADAGTPRIGDGGLTELTHYLVPAGTQVEIFVRVESRDLAGCYVTDSFFIENIAVPAVDPTPLVVCDTDNDGHSPDFDLDSKIDEIRGGDTSLTVTFHPTELDAESGVNPISSPYANDTPYNDMVYVRVEGQGGCATFTTLDLIVEDSPLLKLELPAIERCDLTGSGRDYFDLEEVIDDSIFQTGSWGYKGLGHYEYSFYETEADALAGTHPIPDPDQYRNSTPYEQNLWIRVQDPDGIGCSGIAPFKILIHRLPEPAHGGLLELCDDEESGSTTDEISYFDLTQANSTIRDGDDSLTVTWFETHADEAADNPIANPTHYANTSNGQTVVARVTSEFGCTAVTTLTLVVHPLPTPTPSADLEDYMVCTANKLGFAEFDLINMDEVIRNHEQNVEITYHFSFADAVDGHPELPKTNYVNTVEHVQTVYARATNTVSGCFSIVEFDLVVEHIPDIPTDLPDIFLCELPTGDTKFDLTQNETLIYGSQDPNDFTITYFNTEAEAEVGSPIIGNPEDYLYTSPDPKTIWVRIENDASGCYAVSSFDIQLGGVVEIEEKPTPLVSCDVTYGTIDDEIALFDLTVSIPEITMGDTSLEVKFYEDAAQMANDNPIATPEAYVNLSNPQTIYVGVTSYEGCTVSTTLRLEVLKEPVVEDELDPMWVCDVDYDGYAEFDLAAKAAEILHGYANMKVTFHLTELGAERNTQTIDHEAGDFEISNPDHQRIWVRVENTVPGTNGTELTGCFTIRPLDLYSTQAPEIERLEDLYICEDTNGTNFAIFDLTEQEDYIFGGNPIPSHIKVTYHEQQAWAEAGIHPINVPSAYMNSSNPQRIFVRVEDTVTGCIDTFDYVGDNSFTLNVDRTPEMGDAYLATCNADGVEIPFPQAVFNLDDAIEALTGFPYLTKNQEIVYYASYTDLENNNPIANPEAYVNTSHPQDVWAQIINTRSDRACIAEGIITLEVLPMPSPSVTDLDELRMIACDETGLGIAEFDLTHTGGIIAGGETVNIDFYRSEDAAEYGDPNDTDYIANPATYENEPAYNSTDENGLPTNRQMIYARVMAGTVGNDCYVIVPFELEVIARPMLNIDGDPFGYTLCEDGNSGQARLNLNDIALMLYDYNSGDPANIIPLLEQNPNVGQDQSLDLDDYEITYYASASDAEAGVNPLPQGHAAVSGDRIYVRVEHEETGCYNEGDIGEIIITVEPRPIATPTTITTELFCSDEPGENIATIDLTQYDAQINASGGAYTKVDYYANLDDYNNYHPIADPTAAPVTDGQLIIASVTNVNTLCRAIDHSRVRARVETAPLVDLSNYDGEFVCIDLDPVTTPTYNAGSSSVSLDTGLPELGYIFEWYHDGELIPGATGPVLEASRGGEYTVVVANAMGRCSTSSSVVLEEHNPPEFGFEFTKPAFTKGGGIIIKNIVGTGDYEFRIDNGEWVRPNRNGEVEFTNITPGEHLIVGRDRDGCGETIVPFSLIDYPDFFTPNGDGINDTWNVYGLEDQPDARIYIFDRYGKLLKELRGDSPGWDGTFNGKPMPSNDYWFKVEYMETSIHDGSQHPAEFTGHFTLKR